MKTLSIEKTLIEKKNINKQFFFEKGFIGFEDNKNFTFIDRDVHPFYWLETKDGGELTSFCIINPLHFDYSYKLNIYHQDLEDISIYSSLDTKE